MSRRLLVIGAHSADFVWRAGGVIAVTTARGGTARVLALSYGERGESGELWKEQGQTVDRVKEIRHGEAERAAAVLGAEFECLDLGDYPLEVAKDALVAIADRIRALAPDVLITHTDRDPFNPDHAAAFFAVEKARALAAGAGVPSAFETVEPPELLLFEPHQPELCNFVPTTFVDITPVIEQKNAAMAEMKAQSYLHTYYVQRAEQRGNHARRSSGNSAIRYAEAFQRVTPQVVERALTDVFGELARLGTATVHEAAGRAAVVDVPLIQIVPGSRAAGPARTVRCSQNDNLMVHAAVAEAQPGEVLVLTMPEPGPRRARRRSPRDTGQGPWRGGDPAWWTPSATSRSSVSSASPSGRATSASGERRSRLRARSASRSRSPARRSARVTSSSSTRTGRSSSSASASRTCWRRPAIGRSASSAEARRKLS